MVKNKNKKGLSDKVRRKKAAGEKKSNPFEVKVNRQKHDILGRKVDKSERGMPGRSRSQAFQKRKETLLVEFQKKNKSNKFVDRRIGEADPELSVEDKMLKRFAVERQRHHKSGLFNLNEEQEELTHYGQSLAEIDKFDEPILSDDDDDEEERKISAKMVREEHFGGFLTRRKDEDKAEGKQRSWKEKMEEMIAQSKKDKHVRQSEKEKSLELTEKLDTEWKELRLLMGSISKNRKEAEEVAPPSRQVDDYDKTVQTLRWEMKGTPTDRLKTEEELAKEGKERLDKLEADRMRRMKGLSADEEALMRASHRSADDLDDGLALDKGPTTMVAYKEGRLIGAEEEEEEEGEEEGEGDPETADTGDQSGDDEEEDGSEEDDDDEEGSAMEHTSDLESDKEDEEEEEKPKEKTDTKSVRFSEDVQVGPKDFKSLLKGRKTMMDKARVELPYTFEAPSSYIELLNTFGGHSEDDQVTIIERMRKCNHPSLAEGNKTKLEVLFTLLAEYFCDLAIQEPPCLRLMDKLTRHLYELCQMAPLPAGLHLVAVVKQHEDQFSQYADAHGGRALFPKLDLLMLLKLISQLFPTSDFHHHVATPAMLLMSQVLTQCPVNTRRDIGSGLFVCVLFLEYVSLSKRFVPEVINFLRGILFLAIKKDPKKLEAVIPPFKPVGRNISLLALENPDSARTIKVEAFKVTDVFSRKRSQYLGTDEFRVCATSQCVRLLLAYSQLYKDLPSYREIFAPIKYLTSKLPANLYPTSLQDDISELERALSSTDGKPRPYLTMQKQRPKPMKTFEPKVEQNFDGKKKGAGSRESNEKRKILHKFKKEMKGAVREIRKDTQFLARQKLQQSIEKDQERKRKVKDLYSMLANQEGDYKRLKREKDRL